MEVIVKHLELVIMAFVKFAKMIPRFMDLPLNDQAALVKCKFCETSWRDEGGRVLSISLFKSTQNVYVLPLVMLKHAQNLSRTVKQTYQLNKTICW